MKKLLQELKIVVGDNAASNLFDILFEDKTFLDIEYTKPSEYVKKYWNAYEQKKENQNLNGQIFEIIIATLLYREKILPIYLQAQVAFVPNVNFDILLYSKECGPICLSLKTSLRERYKQADLESIALKYVHRKAQSYLFTLEEKEGNKVKEKIKSGDVIGIDKVIICTSNDLDELIENLKNFKLELAGSVDIIKSSQIIMQKRE